MRENIRVSEGHDITLVNLPGGMMISATKHILTGLNEFWILADTDFEQIANWKTSIKIMAEKIDF